jgi:putative transposase
VEIKNEQKIQKTFKFRLYPTAEQEQKLLWTMRQCKFVYNTLLGWLKNQDKPNRYELQNRLPKLKQEHPELKSVYSKALQYEVYRLFSNLYSLSQSKKKHRKIGRLRYKPNQRFRTIHYNQSGFKILETGKRLDKLHISKMGDIPMRTHRHIDGTVKQVVIKHYVSGKWYVCITVDQKKDVVKHSVKKAVGIDVGIKYFVSDSEGFQFENPIYLKKSLKQLRKRQRHLSRTKKGSNNREKQRIHVARQYEHIENQRNDFLHKLAQYYVENYDVICIEDLNIKGMVMNHHLARYISDASWNKFIQLLSYKAESAGKTVVRVNPRGTSQEYNHGECIDRDYNASLNILQRGLKKLGQGLSEFTPLEIVPPPEMKIVLASTVVESGSHFQNH